MLRKQPLLLIVLGIWIGIVQACTPMRPAALPPTVTATATGTDTPVPTRVTYTLTPAPTATVKPHTATPTAAFTPTTAFTATFTPPPTLTPVPTDPLGNEEAPEGKVLHALLKRREDVTTEPLTATEYQPFETDLLQLMNDERAKAGAAPLKMSSLLSIVAQSHSDEMAAHNYFGHNSLNGLTFEDRIKKAGYTFSAAAENLFAGSGPYNSPEYVVKVWLNSASHRSNMLDPKYNEVGIGYRFNPDSTYGGYFTADFGTP